MDEFADAIASSSGADPLGRLQHIEQHLHATGHSADPELWYLVSEWLDRALVDWDATERETPCGSDSALLDLVFIRRMARQWSQQSPDWHSMALQIESALEWRLGTGEASTWLDWLEDHCWTDSVEVPGKKPRLERCLVCGSTWLATGDAIGSCPRQTCAKI